MEKRVVLFLIISLVIVFFYPLLLQQFQTSKPQTVSREEKKGDLRKEGAHPTERNALMGELSDEIRTITVETDLYEAVFSSQGAHLLSWRLKEYAAKPGRKEIDGKDWVNLVTVDSSIGVKPLTIGYFDDKGRLEDDASILYQSSSEEIDLTRSSEQGVLRFVSPSEEGGVEIIKNFYFERGTYLFRMEVSIVGAQGGYQVHLGTNSGIFNPIESFGGLVGPIYWVNGERHRENLPKIKEKKSQTGLIEWVGQQDKYFLSLILPPEGFDGGIEMTPAGEGKVNTSLVISSPKATERGDFQIYFGPKEYSRLQSIGRHVEESVDFGWFIYGSWMLVRLIAKPLFYLLTFLHQFSQNYGVAIILVTCMIKGVFFPISLKGFRSMKSMQDLQPKLAALKKKHEKDKEKLNREMLELYRTHKVNPVGGCLPMLIQLPVFIALFNVLYVSIEMRHAPFVFWIRDLSAYDPFYILPLLYGVSTYLLQKMQPTGMDPQQARLMTTFIPVVTTFLFLNFPAGLVLYWVVNNLLSIGQQHLMGFGRTTVPQNG